MRAHRGGETVYRVADRPAGIAVAYLFATGGVTVIDRRAQAGRPRLEKPFTRDELLDALATLLG